MEPASKISLLWSISFQLSSRKALSNQVETKEQDMIEPGDN